MNQDFENFNILDKSLQDGSFFQDPHAIYEKLRLEYPILWCQYKNGFYISTKKYIEFILNNSTLYKRITSSIDNVTNPDLRVKVNNFVSQWPFYRNDNYKGDKIKSQAFIASNLSNVIELIKNYELTRSSTNLVSSLFSELSLKCVILSIDTNLEEYENILYYSKYVTKLMQNDLDVTEEHLLSDCIGYFSDLYSKYEQKNLIDYGTFCNLLIDGHEPLTNILTYATIMYTSHYPLEKQYINAFVNELLRFFPSFQYLVRYTKNDIYIDNYYIPENSKLYLVIASANRDKTTCENYDKFDYKRPEKNNHLSFGKGVHSCMGNKLAQEVLLNFILKIIEEDKCISLEFNTETTKPFTGTLFIEKLQGSIT